MQAEELDQYITSDCFELYQNSKLACRSKILLKTLYPLLETSYRTETVNKVLEMLKQTARLAVRRLYPAAHLDQFEQNLNNCGGRWYEILFLDTALFYFGTGSSSQPRTLFFKLPAESNGRRFNNLFTSEVQEQLANVKLRASNPDFVVVQTNQPLLASQTDWKNISGRDRAVALLSQFDDTTYFGKFNEKEIVAILSVKTSTRPDRRYQYLREADVIQAMLIKLATIAPYFIITTQVKPKDVEVFSSPSLLSVFKPELENQPCVNVFEITTFEHIAGLLDRINTLG